MAKPGRQAQELRRGLDLSRARMTDEEAYEAQGMIEMAQGWRCNGCGRRILTGLHFTSIAAKSPSPVMRQAACTRDDCDYGVECRTGATMIQPVEFAWLDEHGPDAPPTRDFLKARERFVAIREAQRRRASEVSRAAARAEQSV